MTGSCAKSQIPNLKLEDLQKKYQSCFTNKNSKSWFLLVKRYQNFANCKRKFNNPKKRCVPRSGNPQLQSKGKWSRKHMIWKYYHHFWNNHFLALGGLDILNWFVYFISFPGNPWRGLMIDNFPSICVHPLFQRPPFKFYKRRMEIAGTDDMS